MSFYDVELLLKLGVLPDEVAYGLLILAIILGALTIKDGSVKYKRSDLLQTANAIIFAFVSYSTCDEIIMLTSSLGLFGYYMYRKKDSTVLSNLANAAFIYGTSLTL